MSKHTPGPWERSEFAGQWNVWPTKKHRKSNGAAVAYDMTPEDARLIAAAPDMLEALIALSEQFEAAWSKQGISCPDVTKARAAIAAATGEQP